MANYKGGMLVQEVGVNSKTTVGILGLMHDEETRNKYGLTLEFIKELIMEFAPDVICGEVLPVSWDLYTRGKAGEGYWQSEDGAYKAYWAEPASEYWRLIFPLCVETGIQFIPVDWLELDVWWDFDPFLNYPSEQRKQLKSELETWFEKQLSTWDQSPIPFNSFAYDEIARAKYRWLEQVNPKAHIFRWVNRHLIMTQRIKNAIKQHEGKRILCIAGADHNYCYYESLADADVQLVYPLR
jgi:hypothetical protein